MEMMKPLCDKNYIIHKNLHSNGCTEYEQMKMTWKVQNPRQPRDDVIQIPVLVITLLLPVVAAVFLPLKQYHVSLVLSGLAFISYGYYEYGVSPYANIRIDLLVIYPMLLVSLAIFLVSAVFLYKKSNNN